MARLLIKSAGFEDRVLKLKLGTNRLGRSSGNDFQIEHPTISAVHCEIELVGDSLVVRDCNSTNGTFVDGKPVIAARLSPGTLLRLGQIELVTESTDVTVSIPRFQVLPSAAPPVILADGSLACPRHPQLRSSYRCVSCREVMCDKCVRRLGRRGGKVHKLCARCSHPCEPIGVERTKKKSLLHFLNRLVSPDSKTS